MVQKEGAVAHSYDGQALVQEIVDGKFFHAVPVGRGVASRQQQAVHSLEMPFLAVTGAVGYESHGVSLQELVPCLAGAVILPATYVNFSLCQCYDHKKRPINIAIN